MAETVNNYQCPACGGPLRFDGATGRLKCDYCDSDFPVEEIEALYARKNAEAEEWTDDSLRVYNCPSCGAELVCDETTAATSCPYCGNPTIVPGKLKGFLKPEFVIPFRLSREEALAALKKHTRRRILLPKAFTDENHLQELRGVYVPFWLYDGVAHGEATYRTTHSSSVRHGDYIDTTTRHYRVERAGDLPFTLVPADAASKMPDDYMDSLEPYDYSELKPFLPAYLPGFFADKYDVSAEDCFPRAVQRCEHSTRTALANTVTGYSTKAQESFRCELERRATHYALLPVWMLNTQWRDRRFLFAMNGQTGKMVGDLPVSWVRFWLLFAGLSAVFSLIMWLILTFA